MGNQTNHKYPLTVFSGIPCQCTQVCKPQPERTAKPKEPEQLGIVDVFKRTQKGEEVKK